MSATFTLVDALEAVRSGLTRVHKALSAPDAEIAALAVPHQDGQPVLDPKDRRIVLAQKALDEAGDDLVAVMFAARHLADLRTRIKVDERGSRRSISLNLAP